MVICTNNIPEVYYLYIFKIVVLQHILLFNKEKTLFDFHSTPTKHAETFHFVYKKVNA